MSVVRSLLRIPICICLVSWSGSAGAQMISNTADFDPAQSATRELDKAGGYEPNTQVLGIVSNIQSDNGSDIPSQLHASSSPFMGSDAGSDQTLGPNPFPSSLATRSLAPASGNGTGRSIASSSSLSTGPSSLSTGFPTAVSSSLPNTLANGQASNLGFNNSSPTAPMGRFQQFSMNGLVSSSYVAALPPNNSGQSVMGSDYLMRSDAATPTLLFIPSIAAGSGYIGLLYGLPAIWSPANLPTLAAALLGNRPTRFGMATRR